MLFKVVLNKQIRVFDCKETPSIQSIRTFISKTFPKLKQYIVYYIDEDNDQIALETDSDLTIFLSDGNKKPKIFINTIQQQSFEATVKIQIHHKEQEKQLIKVGEDIGQEKIQQKKEMAEIKEEEPIKIEKSRQKFYWVKCDGCGSLPIVGIKFSCNTCNSLNFCKKCEKLQMHQHPLNCEQLLKSIKMEFDQAKASLIAQKLKNSQHKNKQRLVYQYRAERQQIIISYLGNLLGEDDFLKYREFSQISKCENYDDIVEEYLNWRQGNETNFHRLTNWILKYIARIRQRFQ